MFLDETSPSLREKFRFAGSFFAATLLLHNAKTRRYWDEIVPGLILGALPISTKILGHGDHGQKILAQCQKANRPLSLVVSAVEGWELLGKGLFLKTVSREFWKSHDVAQTHLEIQDFTGGIDPALVNKTVDDMHKQIKKGKSVYVHCKAGRGRSFMFVACYLMKHQKMDVNQALETIYAQRSHVSPSMDHFDKIEIFRQKYCPKRKPLDKTLDSFFSYRKDWGARLYRLRQWGVSVLFGGAVSASLRYFLGLSFLAAGVGGFVVAGASKLLQGKIGKGAPSLQNHSSSNANVAGGDDFAGVSFGPEPGRRIIKGYEHSLLSQEISDTHVDKNKRQEERSISSRRKKRPG